MPTAKKTTKKTEEVEEIAPAKIKKEFDLEGAEIFPAEKAEEVELFAADTEEAEELADEVELDTEEINPFGDKWEE